MKAEDFIQFIESGRFDKISNNGLELIAKRFRELTPKESNTVSAEEILRKHNAKRDIFSPNSLREDVEKVIYGAMEEYKENNNWISVEEELPKEKVFTKVYNVCYKNGNVGSAWFNPKEGKFKDDDITHWQPLPNPPKQKQ